MSPAVHHDFDLAAFPTVTEAAHMLGINKSTVSKRAEGSQTAGGTRRIPPAEVLRLGLQQRKVPLTQVARALVDYAERHAPSHRRQVEEQVREFFAADRERTKSGVSREDFLRQARELLDERAYRTLEQRYDATYGRRPSTHLISTLEGVDA